jgi:hypothetical protein
MWIMSIYSLLVTLTLVFWLRVCDCHVFLLKSYFFFVIRSLEEKYFGLFMYIPTSYFYLHWLSFAFVDESGLK